MLAIIAMLLLCAVTGAALFGNWRAGGRLLAGWAPWIGFAAMSLWIVHFAVLAQGLSWLTRSRAETLMFSTADAGDSSDPTYIRVRATYDRDPWILAPKSRATHAREVELVINAPISAGVASGSVLVSRQQTEGYCVAVGLESDGYGAPSASLAPGEVESAVLASLEGWKPTGDAERDRRAISDASGRAGRLVLGDLQLGEWGIDPSFVERHTLFLDHSLAWGTPKAESQVLTAISVLVVIGVGVASQRTVRHATKRLP